MQSVLKDIFDNPNTSPEHFKTKYPDFFEKYPVLSEKVFDPNIDKDTLRYMLEQKNRIEANRQSEYDASVKVGSHLVDKYVKPDLENQQNKNKNS